MTMVRFLYWLRAAIDRLIAKLEDADPEVHTL